MSALRLSARGPAPSNVDVAVEALRDAIVDGRAEARASG